MSRRKVKVTLVGGPAHGQTVEVERDVESISLGGFFTYTMAGAKTYVIKPRNRRLWRFIMAAIGKNGKHPFIDLHNNRQQPQRGRPLKRQRGAIKRGAKRVSKENA